MRTNPFLTVVPAVALVALTALTAIQNHLHYENLLLVFKLVRDGLGLELIHCLVDALKRRLFENPTSDRV